MSELRSAIESLRAEPVAELADAQIEEDFEELHRAVEQLEVERLRRLAEIDRRRLFERDGHLSAAAWLVRRLDVAWGAARNLVRLARGLAAMPRARGAVEAGDLSLSAARVLASAQAVEPEAFERSEPLLVEAARIHAVGDLSRVTAHWRQVVQRERGIDPEEAMHARRRFFASVLLDGMVRVDGDLDPETGDALLTALRAVMDAEALGRSHGSGRTPGPAAELDHVGPVSTSAARRIACDAAVMRVVTAGPSRPLDVGRRTKVVSPALRRAVIVRDRSCRFPGCDRPHPWCDAHHVVHWADGGATSLENLLLLCRPHHRVVHRPGRISLELIEGRPVFRRADGSILEDHGREGRAPP